MWWFLLMAFAGFIVVHLAKMMRLYLVLMEHRIKLSRFILLYLKTTFVNLVVPFKLGEVYRVFCISRETKLWPVGILSVVVDRFFDIVALFLVLLPFDLFIGKKLSFITAIFFVLIVFAVAVFASIAPTYRYLNRYIIMHKTSKRAIWFLKVLDIIKNWYDFTNHLIKGRFPLIIVASSIGWIAEVGTLKALSLYKGITFGIGDFSSYMEAIFLAGKSPILKTYTVTGAVAIAVFLMIGLVSYYFSVFLKARGRE